MLQRYNLYSKKLYVKNSKGDASLKPGLIWAGYKVIQSSPPDNYITRGDIAMKVGVSVTAVQKHVNKLKSRFPRRC